MKDPYKRTRKYGDQPGQPPKREHRVLAETQIGRALEQGEVVHHRDGDKTNNSTDNIKVLPSQSIHMVLEHYQRRERSGIVHLFELDTWLASFEPKKNENT
jgi:HNH endonuclease